MSPLPRYVALTCDLELATGARAEPPDGALATLDARVTRRRRLGTGVRVNLTVPGGGELVAELPARTFAALGLAAGHPVTARVRHAPIFPVGAAHRARAPAPGHGVIIPSSM